MNKGVVIVRSIMVICLAVALGCALTSCVKKEKIKDDTFLISLLGKNIENLEIKNFLSSLKEEPEIFDVERRYGIRDPEGHIYYSFKKNGLSFLFEKEKLHTIFLYSEGHDGFKQYKGTIPGGISFSDDRSNTNKKLGLPSQSGGGGKVPKTLKPTINAIPIHDKWRFPRYSLHIQYYNDGKISLVSLFIEE